MAERKRYAVAVRGGLPPVPDLADRLAKVEGVQVLSASERRARVEATPEAADRLRTLLAESCIVEELVPRWQA